MHKMIPVRNGAEAFIELLNSNGVEYIFLNPGTDTFPITQAISHFKSTGRRCPEVVLCLHESVAMAAAHGYFMLANKPQVVIVHADLGPLQVGGALHNAQRGRIGVLLCSGRVPANLEQDRRNIVHWLQEQYDQSGPLRGYVKWDYELRSCENIHHVVQRAFQMAASEPCGPVYLSLPQDTLTQKISRTRIPDPARYAPVLNPQIDERVLEEAAELLAKSRNPLIICGYAGRHPEAVQALVDLAETLGARIIDSPINLNFPNDHSLYSGFEPNPFLASADVILAVDTDVPYVPAQVRPGARAKIIHIDIDPLKENLPLWGFPVDLLIRADSVTAMRQLQERIASRLTPRTSRKIAERKETIAAEHRQRQEKSRQLALSKKAQKPISPEWLCYCIDQALDQEAIVVAETVTNRQALLRQLRRTRPASYFQSGGSSLGWGLGAALGAKLARPASTVVALVGDGSFVFGCPTAALWDSSASKAPFLTVIFNNERYNAPNLALNQALGRPGGSEQPGIRVGIDIQPPPDYASIARACFAYAKRVEDPDELLPALKTALHEVRSGRSAVLDVAIST
jgi:acetolactate synthase I/II/III large subunit